MVICWPEQIEIYSNTYKNIKNESCLNQDPLDRNTPYDIHRVGSQTLKKKNVNNSGIGTCLFVNATTQSSNIFHNR